LSVLAYATFIVLKAIGVISWSWWWILLAPPALGVAVGGAMAAGVVILYMRHSRSQRLAERLQRRMLATEPPFESFGYRISYSGFRPRRRVQWRSSAAGSRADAARRAAEDGDRNP
jgi:hypothetical protein